MLVGLGLGKKKSEPKIQTQKGTEMYETRTKPNFISELTKSNSNQTENQMDNQIYKI